MHSDYTQIMFSKTKTADTGISRLIFDIILSLTIVMIFAFILNWIDAKISYQSQIKYKDVPTYTEHADQRFIQDFLKTGYINKNINLSLL